MIDINTFSESIKKNKIENCYVFCGGDEQLISEGINSIVNKVIDKSFLDLNYIKFDGNSLESFDVVVNACETVPFMSDRKVVLVYRASFIEDDKGQNSKFSSEKAFNTVAEYLDKVPPHCILILYDVFKSKRDKPGKRIQRLDKKACVVKADKIKGQQLESKIKGFFEARNKKIEKVELKVFCSLMDQNNLSIIENEVEKLCCYVNDKDITKEDIKNLFLSNNDDDIFDLIDRIANKKLKESLEILNELMYKGEKATHILNRIEERGFNQLFRVKICLENKKSKQDIMKELKIWNDYVCDKIIGQSKKFTLKQLKRAIELCLVTERKIKSSNVDEKTEMELLIINAISG